MLLYDSIAPYGLIYLAGVLLLLSLLKFKLRLPLADSLYYTVFISLFTIIGARIGYAGFYEPAYYAAHPFELVELYKGGMSFHGALLGLASAVILVIKDRLLRLQLCDLIALTALILLPCGRIINYLGGEIYGTEAAHGTPFALIYPALDFKLRHAVTLYEASGYLIFVLPVLWWLKKRQALNFPGAFACAFALLQGLLRFTVDFWREPDLSAGLVFNTFGLGQILALGQLIGAAALYVYLRKRAVKHD